METTQERLIRYLDDAWGVEKGLVTNLKEMAKEVNDPQVRMLFEEHASTTHDQEERLEARIRALGEEPSGGKGFFNKMMAAIADVLHGAHDEYDKTTQDLMKAYATEHFEMAMYNALENYAMAIGDQDTAALARSLHDEESQTAARVWPQIAAAAARSIEATDNVREQRRAA